MFDVSNYASFKKVDSWIEKFKDKAGDSTCVVLLGNKCDLPKEVNDQEIRENERKYGNVNYLIKRYRLCRNFSFK